MQSAMDISKSKFISNYQDLLWDISSWKIELDRVHTWLVQTEKTRLWMITRPRGYKTFFMLKSAKHEILNAQISLECYFFCS